MRDEDYVSFLAWALPRLRGRFAGYRNVRGQVCKRIRRRIRELGLTSVEGYRAHLEAHAEEWARLDEMCRVSISRFYRDGALFDELRQRILPRLAESALARGAPQLRLLCAGSASGEEPYTLAIVWNLEVASRFPGLELSCVATEIDPNLLLRAQRGCYAAGTLRELPAAFRDAAFVQDDGLYCVRDELRRVVDFRRQDLRVATPEGVFDLILCRNLAFTYFDEARQREVAGRLIARLVPGGVLVLGRHESLPSGVGGVSEVPSCALAYAKIADK